MATVQTLTYYDISSNNGTLCLYPYEDNFLTECTLPVVPTMYKIKMVIKEIDNQLPVNVLTSSSTTHKYYLFVILESGDELQLNILFLPLVGEGFITTRTGSDIRPLEVLFKNDTGSEEILIQQQIYTINCVDYSNQINCTTKYESGFFVYQYNREEINLNSTLHIQFDTKPPILPQILNPTVSPSQLYVLYQSINNKITCKNTSIKIYTTPIIGYTNLMINIQLLGKLCNTIYSINPKYKKTLTCTKPYFIIYFNSKLKTKIKYMYSILGTKSEM